MLLSKKSLKSVTFLENAFGFVCVKSNNTCGLMFNELSLLKLLATWSSLFLLFCYLKT